MCYDTPVYFQSVTKGQYNELTGDYADDTINEVKLYASVQNTGIQYLKLVYGSIKQGSLTLSIQNHYDKPFNYIRIDNKRYQVDLRRTLRTKETFIVSEVQ